MLTESKKKLREWCLRTYRRYKLSKFTENVSLHNFFSIEDYKLLSSRKKDYGKDLAERFFSTIDYIRILFTEEVTGDYSDLINKVADSLKTYAGVELPTNHNKIIEDIKKDKELAISLIANKDPRHDLTDPFLNSVGLVFYYMNGAFDNESMPNSEKRWTSLYKDKQKMAVLDYYFNDFCSIDDLSLMSLNLNLVGIYRTLDNESESERVSRIEISVARIYEVVCESLKSESKLPSIDILNRLPYLLKLSQVTKKEYDNIKKLYKDMTPTDIFNSIMNKKKETEFNFDFMFPLLYSMLDYEYFQLFKILVPLSLLTSKGRRAFNDFTLDEFGIGFIYSSKSRYNDDTE